MNPRASTIILILLSLVFSGFYTASAQNSNSDKQSHSNYTATSINFPFMGIIPDAQTSSMGEAGVARTPDVNSLNVNPSAIVFSQHRLSFGLSHNPWLNRLIKDMSLSYFGASLNNGKQAIGLSLRYFAVGETVFRNEEAVLLGMAHPREYAFDFTYARKLSPDFALGATIRYVQSRLSLNEQASAMQATAAAVAADVSAYLRKPAQLFGYPATVAAGINLSNIGPSTRTDSNEPIYLPTNLRMGTSASLEVDDLSQLTFAMDLSKMLVPATKTIALENPGTAGFPVGMWRSFSDQPLIEELKAISLSFGMDYSFKQQFSIRAGYHFAPQGAGTGSYPTLGAGFRYQSMQLDLAYLPGTLEKSPTANTLKISLMFNFGALAQSRHGYISPF